MWRTEIVFFKIGSTPELLVSCERTSRTRCVLTRTGFRCWQPAVMCGACRTALVRGQSGPRLYTTWSQPGGSIEGAQYSALKQINKSNVHQLELQWFHPAPGPIGRFAFSPLVVDNVMYVVGKDSAVFALDAVDGQGNLAIRYRRHADQPRFQLLGEQGPFRSPHHLRVAQLPAAARRTNGEADHELRHQRPREPARGARPYARADRWRAVGIARGRCARTSSSSVRRRARATTRRPATFARSTC